MATLKPQKEGVLQLIPPSIGRQRQLRPLDEAERNRIYHRVLEEKYSPQLVSHETGYSVVTIRGIIREKGGILPSRYTHTFSKAPTNKPEPQEQKQQQKQQQQQQQQQAPNQQNHWPPPITGPTLQFNQTEQNVQVQKEHLHSIKSPSNENLALDNADTIEDGSIEQGIPQEITHLLPTVPLPQHNKSLVDGGILNQHIEVTGIDVQSNKVAHENENARENTTNSPSKVQKKALENVNKNTRFVPYGHDINDKELRCLHCMYQTRVKNNFRLHCKALHGVIFNPDKAHDDDTMPQQSATDMMESNTSDIKKKCEKCDFSHHLAAKMDKHKQSVHKLISNPFKCPKCPYEYSAERLLKWHMEETHKTLWCVQCSVWPCKCPRVVEQVHVALGDTVKVVDNGRTVQVIPQVTAVVPEDNGKRMVHDVATDKSRFVTIEQFKCKRCMVEFSSLEEMTDMSNHDEKVCGGGAEQGPFV